MKLLFITQKMDIRDDVLGAYHGWVTALAQKFESIIVICLYEGEHHLPENVKVLSLGKEGGISRIKYITRFFSYIWRERKNYNSVFVHMNVEYMLLGWGLWRILRKKCVVWYNHTYGTWKGTLAFRLADVVFHTSPFAFSSGRKHSLKMPAGILVEKFKPDPSIRAPKNSVLYIGRLSLVKNVDILVQAVVELNQEGIPAHLDLYGSPDKPEYLDRLKARAREGVEKGYIQFRGSVPNKDAPQVFNAHEVCVNLTPRGNFDKTVLEAMACERISVVSSEAFKDIIPEQYMFKEKDVADLKRVLRYVFTLSDTEKRQIGIQCRKSIVDEHSLTMLVEKIYTVLS